jgi:RNA polymerase sigma-70 factor (family 1)
MNDSNKHKTDAEKLKFSDRQFLSRLKDNDNSAFQAIYNHYWSVLYGHAYRMLGDHDQAKDVVQEVFIKLWQSRHSDIRENLGGYLYRMVRYRVLNTIRSHRTGEAFLDALAAFATEVDTATLDHIDAKALAIQLDREIDRLPEKMREIFVFSRKEYLSHKEIAEKLDITERTVKNQITSAIRILRTKMGGMGTIALLLAGYMND